MLLLYLSVASILLARAESYMAGPCSGMMSAECGMGQRCHPRDICLGGLYCPGRCIAYVGVVGGAGRRIFNGGTVDLGDV
jgi:hypothetical protein